MKEAAIGQKCIAWGIVTILTAWVLCILLPNLIPAADSGENLGLGLIVVLTFTGMHVVGTILALVGTGLLIHALKAAKEARTAKRIDALIVGASTCGAAGWYVWFLMNR